MLIGGSISPLIIISILRLLTFPRSINILDALWQYFNITRLTNANALIRRIPIQNFTDSVSISKGCVLPVVSAEKSLAQEYFILIVV